MYHAPSTSFARFGRRQAQLVLFLFTAFTLFCVAISCSPLKNDHRYNNLPGEGDLALYRAEANRIAAGESYYSAIATELRARGYPTQSIFNWRMPLPVWLVGKLPAHAAQGILCLASLGVFFLGWTVMQREAGTLSLFWGLPLLFGGISACWVGNLFLLTELWAGIFIALSLCAYATNRPWWGVAAGLAAQFLRELSAVYTLVALGLAMYRRRWREVAVWGAGLACYAVYAGYHMHVVSGLIRPDDLAQSGSWIRFGAAPFVIGTAHVNSLLLLHPQWLAALYFALAMLGFASWNTRAGLRFGLTMVAYVMAFSVVGQYYNQYWGAIYAPLLSFGAARAPAALRDLWRVARSGKALSPPSYSLPASLTPRCLE
jgi:hypothetical protein